VPEGIIDVIPVDLVVRRAVIADGRPATDGPRRAGHRPGGVGLGQPAALPPPGRPCATGSPSTPLRQRRPAHRRARVVFPGRGRVQAPARAGQGAARAGRKVLGALPLRGRQAEWAATLERSARRPSGPWATSSSTAPTPSARPSTASTTCWSCWDSLDDADRDAFCFDPRVIDWDHYVHGSTCPRWSSTPGSRPRPAAPTGESPRRPPAPPGARPRPPPRRLRPREHAHRLQRGGLVLLAGHPPAAPRGPAAVRPAHPGRGAVAAGLDRKDRSDFLRQFYRRYDGAPVEQLERTPSRCSAT
jgi:alcohol-forming fatty acyl-CoA reductase